MDAILLQNQLQSDLEKKIETIRREAYELGWEQAKSKKDRKNDWFNEQGFVMVGNLKN